MGREYKAQYPAKEAGFQWWCLRCGWAWNDSSKRGRTDPSSPPLKCARCMSKSWNRDPRPYSLLRRRRPGDPPPPGGWPNDRRRERTRQLIIAERAAEVAAKLLGPQPALEIMPEPGPEITAELAKRQVAREERRRRRAERKQAPQQAEQNSSDGGFTGNREVTGEHAGTVTTVKSVEYPSLEPPPSVSGTIPLLDLLAPPPPPPGRPSGVAPFTIAMPSLPLPPCPLPRREEPPQPESLLGGPR